MVCYRRVCEFLRSWLSIVTLLALTFGYYTSVQAAVGRTPGNFSVSASGSADYSIPVWAPPGPAGIQPQLSLSYDSRSPIGALGVGWSIAGLGSITRCPKTVAQDGVASPVTLAVSDGYCLNGNRLRLTSAAGTYGLAGSTYQTEITDFSQITAEGTAGNGPAYFTVKAPNGLTYEYGFTDANGNGSNSQILANGTALTWLLSKVIDPAGNNYVINYTTLSGAVVGTAVPDTVFWTPTAAGASSYLYKMKFNYGPNVPQSSPDKYIGGAHVANPELLTSIEIFANNAVVKDYFLGYQSSSVTGREQLTYVTECADSAESNCYSPTAITYGGGTAGVSTTVNTALSATGPHLTARYDLNGDGYPDIVYEASDSSAWYVSFGSSSGYGSPVNIGINANVNADVLIGRLSGGSEDGVLADNNGTWYYYSWNGAEFTGVSTGIALDTSTSDYGYQLADINGDGLPDLVELVVTTKKLVTGATVSTASISTRLNTGSGGGVSFSSSATTAYTAGTVASAQLVTPDVQYSKLRRYDFNGDGQDDLVLLTVTGSATAGYSLNTIELISNGSSFTASQIASVSASTYIPVFFTDWNDDACTDFVTGNVLYVAGCNGTAATTFTISGTVLGAMDWNGDGRTDLLVANGSTIGVYLSTGSGISALNSTSIPYSSSCTYVTMDAAGGGLDDLGCWNANAASSNGSVTYYLHNGVPDLATEFNDGYGNSASPTYVPMDQAVGSTYFPWNDAAYPYQNYMGPLYIVNHTTFSDPSSASGATYATSNFYGGAWTNLQGRGFAGFANVQTYDSRNGMWYTLGYARAFPYTGMYNGEVATQNNSPSTYLWIVSTTPSATTVSDTAYQESYFPYASNVTRQDFELGTSQTRLVKTTSTTYTYDNYGNATGIAETITDNDTGSPYYTGTWSTTVTNTPDASPSTGCLRLLSQSQVSYTSSVGSTVPTLTKQFTPDTTNCRYTQIVTAPGSAYQVTEAIHYDEFGNVDSDAVTGAGMGTASPATRTTTLTWYNNTYPTGQFPLSVQDPSGATTQLTYNYSYGLPASNKDPNGETTSWQYDGFGRKTQETRPDGTYTQWIYLDCSIASCPIGGNSLGVSHYLYYSDGSSQSSGTMYFDALERPFMDNDMLLVSGTYYRLDVRYDSLGRITQRAAPCVWSGMANICPYMTTTNYDILNRITQVQRPTSSTNSTLEHTNYTYEGRTTLVQDPTPNTTTIVNDVNGWLRQTTDPYGYTVTTAYDAAGNKTGVTDNAGNTLWSGTYAYGVAPFLLNATDMDLGAWSYTIDALGERTAWQDAKGQSFGETYDALSRPLTRTEPDQFTQWTWGASAANYNFGKLQSVCMGPAPASGSAGACTSAYYSETESYDSVGRLSQRAITIPSTGTFTYAWQYNATTGLLNTLTYPASTSGGPLQLQYQYQNGFPLSVTAVISGSPNVTVWQANTTNAAGQVTQETLGNGIVTNRAYDAVTGWLSSIQSGVNGGTGVQNQSFLYDLVGDVTQRQDNNLGLTENIYYDYDYRLSTSKLGGIQNLGITYDLNGNITSRSDVASGATWTYDPVRKHAVTQAGSSAYSYSYDGNGNAITRQGSSIAWSSYNYPTSISAGSGSTAESVGFSYGPDRQRWQQTYAGNSTTETTTYVGGLMEVVTSGGVTTYRHYIPGNGSTVAIYSRNSSGVNVWNYVLTDHQASASAITNSSGGAVVNESYTPFGVRRNPTTWSGAAVNADLTASAAITRQGYTGQTALGLWMGLNHMNGRVQDAVTGRFLSADWHIADATNTQDYNRYSYVMNNPLSYIDPSGFCPIYDEQGNQTGDDGTDCGQVTVEGSQNSPPLQGNPGQGSQNSSPQGNPGQVPNPGGQPGEGGPNSSQGKLPEVPCSGPSCTATVQGKCWNGQQGGFGDFVGGLLSQVGNDVFNMFQFGLTFGFNQAITDSLGVDLPAPDPIPSNNTNAGILGSDLAPAAEILAGGTVGGGETLAAKGAKSVDGLEFSHWFPDRWGGPNNILNGNYVDPVTHALSDPKRYRFAPRSWKANNPMPSLLEQQFVRLPLTVKGGGAGALVSAFGGGC